MPLQAPVLTATRSTSNPTTAIDLSWTDPNSGADQETRYLVKRHTVNNVGAAQVIAVLPPNTTSYTDSGLPQNPATTTYYYWVWAEQDPVTSGRKLRVSRVAVVVPMTSSGGGSLTEQDWHDHTGDTMVDHTNDTLIFVE